MRMILITRLSIIFKSCTFLCYLNVLWCSMLKKTLFLCGLIQLDHTIILRWLCIFSFECVWIIKIIQETYPYYSLPFCKPEHGIETKKRPSGIGEVLEGNELRNSGFKLHFKCERHKVCNSNMNFDVLFTANVDRESICDMKLDSFSSQEFELAVDRQVRFCCNFNCWF